MESMIVYPTKGILQLGMSEYPQLSPQVIEATIYLCYLPGLAELRAIFGNDKMAGATLDANIVYVTLDANIVYVTLDADVVCYSGCRCCLVTLDSDVVYITFDADVVQLCSMPMLLNSFEHVFEDGILEASGNYYLT